MVCGLWSLGYGPCAVDYGLWAVEIGSVGLTNSQSLGLWSVGCDLWAVVFGLWAVCWTVGCGKWVCGSDRLIVPGSVVCGLWSVGCGLWALRYVLWTMDCGPWKLGLWV